MVRLHGLRGRRLPIVLGHPRPRVPRAHPWIGAVVAAKFDSGLFHGTQGSPQTTTDQLEPQGRVSNPALPSKRSQLMHVFRDAPGHLPYTDESVARIEGPISDERNIVGTDTQVGRMWYARIESDGTQLWASVLNGTVQDCATTSPSRDRTTSVSFPAGTRPPS